MTQVEDYLEYSKTKGSLGQIIFIQKGKIDEGIEGFSYTIRSNSVI